MSYLNKQRQVPDISLVCVLPHAGCEQLTGYRLPEPPLPSELTPALGAAHRVGG